MISPFREEEMTDNSDKHNAIEKACAILLSFLPDNEAASTTDLSRSLGFHKATTSRTLKIMTEYGFVRQNEATKKYSLGASIVKLAAAVNRSLNSGLVSLARPYMLELRKKTGQTVSMEVISGRQPIMSCIMEGDIAIRVAGQTGDILQWNTTAGVRSILAFADDEFVEEMLTRPMAALTEHSIVDPLQYKASLKKVRRDGYAYESGEVVIGVGALAAPVLGHDGLPLSSISVVGLAHDIKLNRAFYIEALKMTVKDISQAFLYCDTADRAAGGS